MKRILLAALIAFPLLAHAQYPAKPLRAVVAFGTGGAWMRLQLSAPSVLLNMPP